MPDHRRIVTALLFAFLPLISIAQESFSQAKMQNINQIISETNVEEELKSPIEQVQNQFSQNPFGLPAPKNEKMMNLYTETFKPEATIQTIRSTFQEQYNASHANAVIGWLEKDRTQKVLDAEKEFHTLQGIRKRIVNKYELEQNPPAQDRKELIQSLAQKTSASETELEARIILFRTMVSAFSKLSSQPPLSSRRIDGIVNNRKSQIQTQIDQQVTNQLMVKYHGIDDNVLKNYIAFYSTDAGKWLNNSTSKSIQAALKSASDEFLSEVDNIN